MGYYESDCGYYEPSAVDIIVDEYSAKMKEILLDTVKNEIETLRSENEGYKETIKSLRQQVSNIKQKEIDLERNKNKIIADAQQEVRRLIYGGFAVGDKCWIKDSESKSKPCSKCKGEGILSATINDITENIKCTKCNGYKKEWYNVYTPTEGVISQVTFKEWNGNKNNEIELWVKYKGDSHKFDLGYVFHTEDECIKSHKV